MDSQNGPSENDPQQRDASGAANAATLQPARRPHAEVDPGSNASKTNKRKGSKRLKYNVRACAECQKRKIKCYGRDPYGPCGPCRRRKKACSEEERNQRSFVALLTNPSSSYKQENDSGSDPSEALRETIAVLQGQLKSLTTLIRFVSGGEKATYAKISQPEGQQGEYEGVPEDEWADIDLTKSEDSTMRFSEVLEHSSSDFREAQQYEVSETSVLASSPVSLLGAGRIDPFRSYPVDSATLHLHELMDHSTTYLWPGLRPIGSDGTPNPLSVGWLKRVVQRPMVMYALLYGASVHLEILRSPITGVPELRHLIYKGETIRLLKEQLDTSDGSTLDDMILTTLCLGSNEIETMRNCISEKGSRSPFRSPLVRAQWLDVYGLMSHVTTHVSAMRALVTLRGGLDKIELEGLAEIIAFADILGATQKMSKPYFPPLNRGAEIYTSYNIAMLDFRSPLGQGFLELDPSSTTPDLLDVLRAMSNLTIDIESYCQGAPATSDLATIIDKRNKIQHLLLSLPTYEELSSFLVDSPSLYEPIRLTSLIYSLAVVIPLPPSRSPHQQLATLLQSILVQPHASACWEESPSLVLWCLILGGIAAFGTDCRNWYIQNIMALSARMGLYSWLDVASEMRRYLWLESACDVGGRELWMEVSLAQRRFFAAAVNPAD